MGTTAEDAPRPATARDSGQCRVESQAGPDRAVLLPPRSLPAEGRLDERLRVGVFRLAAASLNVVEPKELLRGTVQTP